MNVAARLEDLYHIIMLEKCNTEESKEWENARHEIMTQSIHETIKYYGKCYHREIQEIEKER